MNGGACSISVVICGCILFIDELKVVHIGPVDNGHCSFRCLDI